MTAIGQTRTFPNYPPALPHGVEQQLPIAHVDPAILLEAHALEVRDLLESHALVKRDASIVRKRDSAYYGLHRARAQRFDQCDVQRAAQTLSLAGRVEIHGRLG